MAEQSFKQAFAEARRKFRKEPTEANYTFTWKGKKYNILQEGETKKSVMEKYGKSSAPEKSPRPSARPSKSESSGSSSSGPKKRLGYEPNTDTTDDARASRGSGRTSDNPKSTSSSSGPSTRPNNKPSTSSSSGPSTRPNNKPEDSRTQLERDRERIGGMFRKIFGGSTTGSSSRKRMYKGGMVGASNPPTQKGTPRYKK